MQHICLFVVPLYVLVVMMLYDVVSLMPDEGQCPKCCIFRQLSAARDKESPRLALN